MSFNTSLDTAAKALSYVDYDDRDTWVRMAMAMRSEFGADGFDTWDQWSQQSGKYNKNRAREVWRSAKPGGGVSFATLIYTAQDAGFVLANDNHQQISAEQIAERKAKREADERQYADELKQIRGEVKRIANEAWNASLPAYEHPYTTRKGVKILGARLGHFPVYKTPEPGKPIEPFKQIPALLIPVHDKTGAIVSLQGYFFEDQEYYGDRAYLKDGQKQGGYCLLGTPKDTIAIVEGYATGCSVHEATGWAVIVAFDKGNLKRVAETTRKNFPQSDIIIAGDNDHPNPKTGKQDGNIAAAEAGQAINARVILPDTAGMDWNDVHQQHGLEAVQRSLMAHMVPKPANDNKPIEFDKHTPFPEVNGSGKPIATIENLEELLRRMGAIARYNVIKKDHEILIPGKAYSRDNNANATVAQVISHCNRVGMPVGQVEQYLIEIAESNQYNPVLTWVNSKPWDGVKRWDEFCKTITPKNVKPLPDGTPLHIALIKRWMVSAIAAAASSYGISAQGMLVLQGEQNLGKTNWFKSLAPAELDVLQDGVQLRVDDKDSVKQAISNWLVELGEIDATFKKSDIAALKSFITSKNDIMRLPYARKNSDFVRRTVFFGSVNPREFLHDETGNRRYWTIECASVNFEHGFDMQQVWSEIHHWYKTNPHHTGGRPSYTLTDDEFNALNASNESFQVIDPIEERILSNLEWNTDPSYWRWVTTTELLIEIGIDKPTRADTMKASTCIRKSNNDQTRRSNGKMLFLVPSKDIFKGENQNRPF